VQKALNKYSTYLLCSLKLFLNQGETINQFKIYFE
jgi:hypothetical protein